MLTTVQETNEVTDVVIVEDYKLTRMGLSATLSDFASIRVIGEAEDATSGIEMIKKLK